MKGPQLVHYVNLFKKLSGLCEAGGEQFQYDMIRAAGYSCIGQLLDIYVEMLLQFDKYTAVFLTKRHISSLLLLFQNELEVVTSLTMKDCVPNHLLNAPVSTSNLLLNASSQPLRSRTKVAIILALSRATSCAVVQNPNENSFKNLLQQTLLPVAPFWPAISLFIGYFDAPCQGGNVSRHPSGNIVEESLINILHSVFPLSSFSKIHLESYSDTDFDYGQDVFGSAGMSNSDEVNKLLMTVAISELANEDYSSFNYYLILPEDMPPYQIGIEGYGIFTQLENIVLNDRLGKENHALHVWNEISYDCAISVQSLASCKTEVKCYAMLCCY